MIVKVVCATGDTICQPQRNENSGREALYYEFCYTRGVVIVRYVLKVFLSIRLYIFMGFFIDGVISTD